jgi:hypothetical protein
MFQGHDGQQTMDKGPHAPAVLNFPTVATALKVLMVAAALNVLMVAAALKMVVAMKNRNGLGRTSVNKFKVESDSQNNTHSLLALFFPSEDTRNSLNRWHAMSDSTLNGQFRKHQTFFAANVGGLLLVHSLVPSPHARALATSI